MFILNILFAILMAFLFLLVFLFAVVVIVLVSPIKYRLFVVKDAKLIVDFEGTWLFRMVRLSFKRYEDKKNKLSLKAFGKTLIGDNKKKKRKKAKQNKPKENNETQVVQPKPVQPVAETKPNVESNTKPESKPKPEKEKKPKRQKSKDTEEKENKSRLDTVKKILDFPYKSLLINSTILLLKRLIRAVKPNKFTLKILFGTGDPHTTGQILGLLYGVSGVFNKNIDAKGDFDKARLDFDLYIKGSFTFGRLLFVLFLYAISKPVWEIIRIYRGKSKLVK